MQFYSRSVFYGNHGGQYQGNLACIDKILKGDLNATPENIHVIEEIKDSVVPVEWIKPHISVHILFGRS